MGLAVDGAAGWIKDLDRDSAWRIATVGVVEPGLDGHSCSVIRGNCRQNVNGIQCKCGQINKAYVTIEPAVEAEVADIGGDAFGIVRVIAKHGDADAFAGFRDRQLFYSVGDVKSE